MSIEERADHVLSSRSIPLWYGVLGPPLAWGAQVVVGDLLFELGCGPAIRGGSIFFLSLKTWSLIVTATCAGAAALGFLVSWRSFRAVRVIRDGAAHERATAFALAGMAVGLVFFLLIAYGFLIPLFLSTCGGSP